MNDADWWEKCIWKKKKKKERWKRRRPFRSISYYFSFSSIFLFIIIFLVLIIGNERQCVHQRNNSFRHPHRTSSYTFAIFVPFTFDFFRDTLCSRNLWFFFLLCWSSQTMAQYWCMPRVYILHHCRVFHSFFLLFGDGAMSKHNLGYYRQKPFVFKQVAFLCLCTLFALHRRQSTLRCRPCSFDGHNPFVRPIIGRSRKERL